MPARPRVQTPHDRARTAPRHPYERIAADLARKFDVGDLVTGEFAPTAAALVAEYDVSLATARRAVALAKDWGVLVNDSNARPRVAARPHVEPLVAPSVEECERVEDSAYWSVVVTGPSGLQCAPRMIRARLADPDSFRTHLVGIVRAEVPTADPDAAVDWIGDFEMRVSPPGSDEPAAILRWA